MFDWTTRQGKRAVYITQCITQKLVKLTNLIISIRVMLTGAPGHWLSIQKKDFITIKGNFVDLFMDQLYSFQCNNYYIISLFSILNQCPPISISLSIIPN